MLVLADYSDATAYLFFLCLYSYAHAYYFCGLFSSVA